MSTTRRELSFDGRGINGPDEFRGRVATFTSPEMAEKYGRLFEAAPEMLGACKAFVEWNKHHDYTHEGCELCAQVRSARAAIARAEGRPQ